MGRNGVVQETGAYNATTDQLAAIAVADSAMVRISGKSGHCDFTMDPKSQYLARLFVIRAMGIRL